VRRYVILGVLLVVLVGLTVWMTSLGSVGIFKLAPPGKVWSSALRHLEIVGVAEILAIAIGIPIGFLVTRRGLRYVSPLLIGIANIGQTIPTLAFIAMAALAIGMGFRAAVIALIAYTVLPIIRNTYAGIRSVDPAVKEAAQGMGMSKWQITTRIEIPLARPVIMAGIRTSTVVNVGTAAVAGMIGAGGLGEIITAGIAVRVMEMVIQGAALTAALAVALDAILAKAEDWTTPRGLKVLKQAQWQS